MKTVLAAIFLAVALLVTACEQESEEEQDATPTWDVVITESSELDLEDAILEGCRFTLNTFADQMSQDTMAQWIAEYCPFLAGLAPLAAEGVRSHRYEGAWFAGCMMTFKELEKQAKQGGVETNPTAQEMQTLCSDQAILEFQEILELDAEDGKQDSSASQAIVLAEIRRASMVNASVEGCQFALDRISDQIGPSAIPPNWSTEYCPWQGGIDVSAYEEVNREPGVEDDMIWLQEGEDYVALNEFVWWSACFLTVDQLNKQVSENGADLSPDVIRDTQRLCSDEAMLEAE